MNRAAASTVIPARREPTIAPIARALVWEECRVGGVVAAVCAAVGVVVVSLLWTQITPRAWELQDGFLLTVVLGFPLLATLLLVLSPANSGHLIGGFSERILWLPVPVSLAVGVMLVMRALFVFAAGAFVVAVTGVLFDGGPPLAMALGFVALYLVVQTLDWARAVISGLTSLLVLAALIIGIFVLIRLDAVLGSMRTAAESAGFMGGLLLVALLGAASYGASLALVSATRKGRRVGIPEVWEWPAVATRPAAARQRPFQTPVIAQTWFELRAYGWTMPAVTLLLPALLLGPAMAFNTSDRNTLEVMALALFGFFLLGALAHGIRARALGIRPNPGKPGFAYLHPLPAAHIALAKSLAALAVLIPTMLAVMAIQTAVLAPAFVTETIPYAWSHGMTNAREIIWALGSRGVLLGLAGWLLMAIGTRTMRRLAVVAPTTFLLLAWLDTRLPDKSDPDPDSLLMQLQAMGGERYEYILPIHVYFEVGAFWIMLLLFAGTSVFVTTRAWRQGLLSPRILIAWGAAVFLTAWTIAFHLPESLPYGPRTAWDYLNETMICLAWASIVPLPFMANVLDASQRRHGASPRQETATPLQPALPRRFAWGTAAPAVLLVVWLTWPTEPAFQQYLRSIGGIGNEQDFRAVYPTVPDDENISHQYLALSERRNELEADRDARWRGTPELRWSDIYISGNAQWPLSERELATTKQYWKEVVAPLMPEMQELAAKLESAPPGGYPVPLQLGSADYISVYGHLRSLARDGAVDTFYWSQQEDSRRTVDGIITTLGVGKSMQDDPMFISLLVAVAIIGIGTGHLEGTLGEVAYDDEDLARLQAYLEHVMPTDVDGVTDRIRHWERVYSTTLMHQTAWQMATFISDSPGGTPGWVLVNPMTAMVPFAISPAAECMASLVIDEHILQLPAGRHTYTERIDEHDRTLHRLADQAEFLAPLTAELAGMSSLPDIPVAVWRMRAHLDTACVGVAAERYRMARGQWPETLDALVPAYIDAVPRDNFAREEAATLRHAVREDGTLVIYSVGPSGTDHGGRERWETDDRNTDDLTFVVGRGRNSP